MAKSIRKYPIVKQEKFNKKLGNRKLRNMKLDFAPRNGQYKKVTKNFALWQYRWTWKEAEENWKNNRYNIKSTFPTLELYKEYWMRTTIRK